ncbi:hypothetical protein ACFP3Q_17695 [Nocardioides sp. GCM10027113]|uniref:hypothetical protein n=1 Tax=unclassified Nocardioides TaxID=2615069 RepID=UPI00360C651E
MTTTVAALVLAAVPPLLGGLATLLELEGPIGSLGIWLLWFFPFLVAPPLAALMLVVVAAPLALVAGRMKSRRGRWLGRTALVLGMLGLLLVVLGAMVTATVLVVGTLDP